MLGVKKWPQIRGRICGFIIYSVYGGALFGDDEVDAEVFDGGAVFWRDASVGDDDVDFLGVADFCEAAFAKLAGVGKHDGFLCGVHSSFVVLLV